MATKPDQPVQVEGRWEDLIRQPNQFAGQRVRVTVLSDDTSTEASVATEIRRWLSEGESLKIIRPATIKPDVFGEGLTEKFRKQGLVF
jgi:hypothetical protein